MSNKMDKRKEFDNILDECLDRVMQGEDIMTVLALYPGFAKELEPLLRTALGTLKAVDIKPRPEFRQRAALEFQQAIRQMPVKAKPARGGFSWRPAWVIPLAVFLVVIIGGSGTVVAAGNSLPDSPLYSVKLAAESVQLALTPSSLGKAELYAKFNSKRVDEIVKMAEQGKADQIGELTDRLSSNMIAMADLTARGGKAVTGEDTSSGSFNMMSAPMATTTPQPTYTTVTSNDDNVKVTMTPAPTTVPPQTTVASATRPVTIAPPVTEEYGIQTAPTITETIAPPPAATRIMVPGGKSDGNAAAEYGKNLGGNARGPGEEKLQKVLTDKQDEELRILYEELEKAPESLKPHIQAAIDVILDGYNLSISNLSD